MCLLYGKCHVHSPMHVKDNLQQILMKEQHFVRIGRWWPVSRQKYAILSTHFLFNQNSHQKDTVIFSSLDSYALVNWLLLDISEIVQYSSFFRTKSFSIYTCTCSMYIKVITKLPNSEQSYKGKVQTHNYINRQNQSTTGKLCILTLLSVSHFLLSDCWKWR